MGWFNNAENHLPLATGPFVPGMIDVLTSYERENPIFRLYYPSDESSDQEQSPNRWKNWLLDESYLKGISKVLMLYPFIMKLVFWWSAKTKIPAIYGARIIRNKKLKCIVLSHGLGGNRFLYTNICCELASRGFLVVALEHRDNSASNTYYYENKSDAERDFKKTIEFKHIKLGKEHHNVRYEQIKARFSECERVLHFLKNLERNIVPENILDHTPSHKNKNYQFKLDDLAGNVDLEGLCMMGHSFGGATALYTLSKRSEFKVGVLLDPWMFPVKNENLEEKITQPLLFINTQTFHIAANVDAMSKLLSSDCVRNMYTIKHTTHENQTDSVLLIGYWLNWFMKKLDPLVALRINNSLIFTFLNKHINFPNDVTECEQLLEKEAVNVEEGLTKPWA
ncbi:platelet-activating factor acetylhydrolase-like [Sitophilus oryzae]|uniref:1-alkyl-2-acetylglycerophosphocholine esterase n=1 Tax=Sitophilus oryzae TaxID=7048 RepID=A0A6J2X5V6_SITOR|nr:platelet-activating factor acetylhydrolase-like [Sitophilus oryzae]